MRRKKKSIQEEKEYPNPRISASSSSSSTSKKMRSLLEVYARGNFCVVEQIFLKKANKERD